MEGYYALRGKKALAWGATPDDADAFFDIPGVEEVGAMRNLYNKRGQKPTLKDFERFHKEYYAKKAATA